jgi:glycosyltransferase involved in cell wall biosynthesis
MTHNVFLSEEEDYTWKKRYINTPLFQHGKIKFIPRVNTHDEVYKIMAEADCGIFPSRAEGWNLEALEMMSVGRNVVITNYSAHTEFCNDSNAILIPVDSKDLAYDDKWFFGQGSWGNVKVEDVAKAMRVAFDRGKNINENGIKTAEKFTWDNTAKEIIDVLEHI